MLVNKWNNIVPSSSDIFFSWRQNYRTRYRRDSDDCLVCLVTLLLGTELLQEWVELSLIVNDGSYPGEDSNLLLFPSPSYGQGSTNPWFGGGGDEGQQEGGECEETYTVPVPSQ